MQWVISQVFKTDCLDLRSLGYGHFLEIQVLVFLPFFFFLKITKNRLESKVEIFLGQRSTCYLPNVGWIPEGDEMLFNHLPSSLSSSEKTSVPVPSAHSSSPCFIVCKCRQSQLNCQKEGAGCKKLQKTIKDSLSSLESSGDSDQERKYSIVSWFSTKYHLLLSHFSTEESQYA